jgi:hypothetical protein
MKSLSYSHNSSIFRKGTSRIMSWMNYEWLHMDEWKCKEIFYLDHVQICKVIFIERCRLITLSFSAILRPLFMLPPWMATNLPPLIASKCVWNEWRGHGIREAPKPTLCLQ